MHKNVVNTQRLSNSFAHPNESRKAILVFSMKKLNECISQMTSISSSRGIVGTYLGINTM